MIKKIRLIGMILFMAAMTAGCSLSVKTGTDSTTGAGDIGGIWKTSNKGQVWTQKNAILSTGKQLSLNGINTYTLSFDPSDSNVVYLGTIENGILYTLDGGESWMMAKSLGSKTVRSIAVDPKDKCNIFVAANGPLYRSTDCLRTWDKVYFDNNQLNQVTYVAIDPSDSRILYIGISNGDLLKSDDRGVSWQVVNRFKDYINNIAVSSFSSDTIFVSTTKLGAFRTINGGREWLDLGNNMKGLDASKNIKDLHLSNKEKGVIFLATNNSILRSLDNGDSWKKLPLLTPSTSGNSIINNMAVNFDNPKEIYYVTNSTFYQSSDGGETWTPKALQTARAGWKLLLDPAKPATIYMGVRSLK